VTFGFVDESAVLGGSPGLRALTRAVLRRAMVCAMVVLRVLRGSSGGPLFRVHEALLGHAWGWNAELPTVASRHTTN
jgi:hypothetical protein